MHGSITYRNNKTLPAYYLGTGRTFDISAIVGTENVDKYTANNFLIEWTPLQTGAVTYLNHSVDLPTNKCTTQVSVQSNFSKSYNNGMLKITGGKLTVTTLLYQSGNQYAGSTQTYDNNPKVYFLPDIEITNY